MERLKRTLSTCWHNVCRYNVCGHNVHWYNVCRHNVLWHNARRHNVYRYMLIAAMLLSYLSGVTGCAGKDSGPDSPQHEVRLFGATYMTMNNPYFHVVNDAIKEVVEANGDILLTRNPLQDQQKQNEQIQELIDEGIELLFLNPVDWEEVQPALDLCRKAGVVIINVDTVVKDQDSVMCIIETDNYQAGEICAQDMVKRRDTAKIVVLDNPIQTSITHRTQGFLDVIEGKGQYQVVYQHAASGEIEVAERDMLDFLELGMDFDVVFGGNDPTALGALAALQRARLEEGVLIYGVDGSPDMKAIIDVGYVTGTSSQRPKYMGKIAAETAYRYLAGEPVEKYINIPSTLITKENLDEFEIDGWQ